MFAPPRPCLRLRSRLAALTGALAALGLMAAACSPPKPPKPKPPRIAEDDLDEDEGLDAAKEPSKVAEAVRLAAAESQEPSAPEVNDGALPPVDAEAAEALVAAIDAAPPEAAVTVAARGLAELEADRLPSFMIRALADYAAVAPDERSMVVSREIHSAAGQEAWDRACAAGVVVFQRVAVAAPAERAGILWRECDLDRLGLFDPVTIDGADPAALLLAALAADGLLRADSMSPAERRAVAALTRPQPAPVP